MSDFTYDGVPKAGSTPPNDADLHTSDNPYGATGSPPVNLSTTSEYRAGSPPGYYTNPPTATSGNPSCGGAAAQASDANADVAAGLDAAYTHTLSNLHSGGIGPTASDTYRDEGYGQSGNGRS